MANRERLDLAHFELPPNEQSALKELIRRLVDDYGDIIIQVILFGSKARGEADPDSDLDVLILTQDGEAKRRSHILRIGARVSLEHDVLLNLLVMSEERWQAQHGFTLHKNVTRDGVPLVR